MINFKHKKQYQGQQKQQGVVLFVALIILLVMMVASVGLLRSVESGNNVAANIAMGQNNQLISDWGIERGFEWLYANRAALDNNNAGNGYYATKTGGSAVLSDANWFNVASWADAKVFDSTTTPAPPAGYTVRVLLNRMCSDIGPANAGGQSCSKGATSSPSDCGTVKVATGAGSASIDASLGEAACEGNGVYNQNTDVPGNIYYRVTVRVEGPKNSLSVVQSMLTIAPT